MRKGVRCDVTTAAFSDVSLPAALPGRAIEPAATDCRGTVRSGPPTLCESDPRAHSICVQPREDEREPFAVGLVRVRTTPTKAASELCDRVSDPSIEVDAVVHGGLPLDRVCDSGYGTTPAPRSTGGTDMPLPDRHALRPGEPTTNAVWTAVEDCTRFEAFSEEGCATGIACTPALHMRSERKTIDERGEG